MRTTGPFVVGLIGISVCESERSTNSDIFLKYLNNSVLVKSHRSMKEGG